MGELAAVSELESDPPGAVLPAMLTVEEAARLLRISRGLAFQEAAGYRETGGREGLPNYQIGPCLWVPTAELARRFGLEDER